MKKRTLILLMALVFALAACGGSPESDGNGGAEQPGGGNQVDAVQPSDAEIAAAYDAAVEAMMWFELGTMPLEGPSDDRGGAKVSYPGIETLDDLEDYLLGLFSSDIVEDLLPGRYYEVDGELYAIDAAKGGNIFKGEETYEVIRESDDSIIYRVTVEDFDPDSTDTFEVIGYTVTDMVYEDIDGAWVFTQFELVR